ncbi:MAG: tRNA pseudouridine(38-40) synthase TruA [Acidobacteriota bacterium]
MEAGRIRTIRMTLQYDGTDYLGWQTQPRGGTVQDAVEDRLGRILDHPLRVHGAGRTDRGVHARGQVGSFATANPLELGRMMRGLNALLPADVAVLAAREVPEGFHARHSARRREYTYQIWRAQVGSPFQHRFVYHLHRDLDLEAMREAASLVAGRHDFTSFCAAESSRMGSNVREVFRSEWDVARDLLCYRIGAAGFLHNMVRIAVGTMLEVGTGRRSPRDMREILEARDRRAAGRTAPARGLFLDRVEYGPEPGVGPAWGRWDD